MSHTSHELSKNNKYIHIIPEELNISLDEVNKMPLDEVVELSSVIIGSHNAKHFGEKWLELNGRHYIMQKIFTNAKLDSLSVTNMIEEIINKKGKVSDEDILQKHSLLYDYLIHYYKSIEKYFRKMKMVKKYAHWAPRKKPKVLIFSELGKQFELLVEEIFIELNVSFTKYNSNIKGCMPDFILSKTHWLDAKLSEHTVFQSETIQKYEPHIDKLTIVYLRKTSQLEWRRLVTPKTELIHISFYLNQLSNSRRFYYEEILRGIEKKTIKNLG
ncbi:hypothetical protein [Bacillus wiedmannii]|uniref:hypothetical protein n=1 Tax=Bacillus wiedmannii TaxID=1890302 RepID=UPI000BEFC079|nr:hypothetical protein [Bacillus wiedmannii]PEM52045.1 hypothetical protein CN618_10085 [Bacillus wiedmannii]